MSRLLRRSVLLQGIALLPAAALAQDITEQAISDGVVSGHFFVPAKAPAPAVFVLHTAWAKEHPADTAYARTLARAGFVAFAINYPLTGKPAWVGEYLRWMKARPEVAGQALGAVGFSAGGRRVFYFAARDPQVKAVVSYYGTYDLATTPVAAMRNTSNPAASPINLLDQVHAAALLLHGDKDNEVPLEQIERMKQAMQAKALPVEAVIYPGVYHCFDRGPPVPGVDRTPDGTFMAYDAAAGRDAEARTIAWFKKYLV